MDSTWQNSPATREAMSWITVKVVKTRGAEEFWFCAASALTAESRGLHAAREAMAVAELAPSKASADLRVRRGLRVACERESVCKCGFATAGLCMQRCFMATSFINSGLGYRIDSYRAGGSELIVRVFGYRAVDCRVGSPTGFSPYCIPKS